MAKATRGTLQKNLDGVSAMTEVTVYGTSSEQAAGAVFGDINDASALSH